MVALSAALLGGAVVASSQAKEPLPQPMATGEAAQAIGQDAYVYGYPLMLVDATLQAPPYRAVTNHFFYLPGPPPPEMKSVIRPNVDTLYTTAMLDLGSEPVVVHVPASKDHYYVVQMMDAYTNVFAAPGTRTAGSDAHDFLVVGPGWKEPVQAPQGVTVLRAPTATVWIVARTQFNGPGDVGAVNAIQKQFAISPWSAWPKGGVPATPADLHDRPDKTPPEQVKALDAPLYFNRVAILMRDNPPPPADAAILGRFAQIGLVPAHPFNPSPDMALNLEKSKSRALEAIQGKAKDLGTEVNGWRIVRGKGVGTYGADYLQRAAVADWGLGANLPEDAVYPAATVDANGHPLDGHDAYLLHFAKDQTPPVNAFWSVTMYDKDGYLVPNPLNRFAARDSLVKKNPDGSVDIYVQADSPGKEREANWLPAPKGAPFNLLLRMYWPKEPVLDGSYAPPGVRPGAAAR